MINLLPPPNQKYIAHEYYLRVASVFLFLLGILGVSLAVILVPSYLHLRSDINNFSEIEGYKHTQLVAGNQNQIAEARAFISQIALLKGEGATSSVVDLLSRVAMLKTEGVTFKNLLYSVSESGEKTLQIEGIALVREDLTSFKDALERDNKFSAVALPIGVLIQRSNISFSLALTLAESQLPTILPHQKTAPTSEDSTLDL